MAITQDYTKMMQDMMGAFPVDTSAIQGMFKNSAEMATKFADIALDAAGKSTEISTNWTRETFAKIGDVAAEKKDISDLGKAVSDFASEQSALVTSNVAAFVEVAKTAQTEATELVMAAGKDLGREAQAMVKTATDAATASKK